MNINSLRYRNKLKFPNNEIDYNKNQEYYIYTKSVNDVDMIQPYNKIIIPMFNIDNYKESKDSCLKIFNLFNNYIENDNFIGADVCRKIIQLGTKTTYNDIFLEKIVGDILNKENGFYELKSDMYREIKLRLINFQD